MATVEETVYARLAGDAALSALVGDRIYPGAPPDFDTPLPWVSFAVPERESATAALQLDNDEAGELDLNIYAEDYTQAQAVQLAVRALLNGYRGGYVNWCLWTGGSSAALDGGYLFEERYKFGGTSAVVVVAATPAGRVVTGPNYVRIQPDGVTTIGEFSPTGLTVTGTVTATKFVGDGSGLTGIAGPDLSGYAKLGAANVFTVGNTITAGAVGTIPLALNGYLTDGTFTADLVRWRDKDGRLGRIDNRGAVICAGSSNAQIGGQPPDLAYAGYGNLGGIRVGADGADNNLYYPTHNLGLAVDDDPSRLIVFRTANRRLQTLNLNPVGGATPILTLWGSSSANSNREMATLVPTWPTNTDATRKARVAFNVYDTAAREAFRIEADGSQSLIGFFGSAAAAKPTITGSRGGNAALASLLTALAGLGLVTDSTTA